VRHQLVASLRPMRDEPGVVSSQRSAKLTLHFLVSDHALESRFYGIASAGFDTDDLAAGSAEKVVWEDGRCHSERGLPKITLVRVDGTVTQDGRDDLVFALLRHRGLRLPGDEVTERKDLGDVSGARLAIEAMTTASRLRMSIKVLARPCLIGGP
jgi:hypothetical protein